MIYYENRNCFKNKAVRSLLSLMRLNMLIGKEAIIVQDLTSIERLNKGYMVELTEPYLDEVDWFIPQESIDDEN